MTSWMIGTSLFHCMNRTTYPWQTLKRTIGPDGWYAEKILIGKVFSSTIEGTGNSFQKFLAHGLDVSATTNKAFLFQGAPDVLIRTETAAVMMCGTDDSDCKFKWTF